MKVSLNWIKQYLDFDPSIEELSLRIGSQLGAIESINYTGEKYKNIYVAEVKDCYKHPDADRLSICLIDDKGVFRSVERNKDNYIQVVCGAPNVRSGLKVAWIPPGAIVPSSFNEEPFILEARNIRGELSNGMIASLKELAISEEHEGIAELDYQLETGSSIAKALNLDDYIIDLENKMFTHRPDCFGIIGVAREIAGIFDKQFKSPDWYTNEPLMTYKQNEADSEKKIATKNDIGNLVQRLMIVEMDRVAVKSSPIWLQAFLSSVGIKPTNNVVDITNYMMVLTGQPLHAFDYDKLIELSDKPSLYPRLSKDGEKLKLLNGKEINLTGDEIVISTDKSAVALAGVMGGSYTEVDNETKRIVIECANFDMYSIRRTSMRYGLFTDAVTRFTKNQSPLQNAVVLQKTIELMVDICGAGQSSAVSDISNVYSQKNAIDSTINVEVDFINNRLGSGLSASSIKKILQNVEIDTRVEADNLFITPPFWRMDLETPVDILEEVGRLYGYDKITPSLPKRTIKPASLNRIVEFKYFLRDKLKQAGANEILTYSFINKNLLDVFEIEGSTSYHIRNALSPDLQYYRPILLASLLTKVHPNIKANAGSDNNAFAIYEIGKTHNKNRIGSDGLPKAKESLAFVVTADQKSENHKSDSFSIFHLAKKYLEYIAGDNLEYKPIKSKQNIEQMPYKLHNSASVLINGREIGYIGEIDKYASKSLKLPVKTAGFEIDILRLLDQKQTKKYRPLSNYPKIKQDLTIDVKNSVSFADVKTQLENIMQVRVAENQIKFYISPKSIYVPVDKDIKKVTFSVELWHDDRTLTNQEVTDILLL